jgi:hypothetical protein
MLSRKQRLEGITSKLKNGLHILFFDIENCDLKECETELKLIQDKYELSDIFISSDCEKSFRAWCFTQCTFKQYAHILSDSFLFHLDYNFFYWTVQRSKATLRIGNKEGREPQKIISILSTYFVACPEEFESVTYDTGNDKKMTNFLR